ncbi:MAG: hypothetical protein WB760_06365 [Xanthobacteraceae bacterium]
MQEIARFVRRSGVRTGDLHRVLDARWYLKRHPEVAASEIDPLDHYLRHGAAAGYDPHPTFCTTWYLHRYPDVAGAGINPLVHYVRDGAFEGRDPHPLFDANWYLARYPDVAASGANPLVHYIEVGAAEGRSPGPLFKGPEDWEMDPGGAAKLRAEYDRGQPLRQMVSLKRKRHWSRSLVGAPSSGLISIGEFCYGRGFFFPASIAYRMALFARFRRSDLRALLAKCDIRLKKFDRAFAWFLRQSDLTSRPHAAIKTVAMPRPSVSNGACRTVCVITSVMPKRIEAQRAALNSWRAAGLSVVSVNSPSEAAHLCEHFPDVSFQMVDQPAVDTRGRPLVPIHAMVQAARNVPDDICGIINSDVEFRGEPAFFDMVRRHVAGSLIFGNRIDVSDKGLRAGKTYRKGYDFFFWERQNSPVLEDSPMVLGLPWWDFWLPLHAYSKDLGVKRFATSSFVHVMHPVGYDMPAFMRLGHLCAGALAEAYSRWGDRQVPSERVFLHRLFSTASAIPADANAQTAVNGMMALCDLTNCMIETVCDTVILPDARLASGTVDLF